MDNPETNLNLKSIFSIPKDNNDFDDIKNDLFAFSDDEWDLSSLIPNEQHYSASHKIMKFDGIKESIRTLVKRHSYFELGRIKPQSVCVNFITGKKKLLAFMDEFSLDSLEIFNTEYFLQYNAWLRDKYITKPTKEKAQLMCEGRLEEAEKIHITQERKLYHAALWLKQLVDNARNNNWSGSPKSPIILELSLLMIWGLDRKQQYNEKRSNAENRLIPDAVFDKVVSSAEKESVYQGKTFRMGQAEGIVSVNFTKFAILTLAFTGLRISEALSLKSGCFFKDKYNRSWLKIKHIKLLPEPQQDNIRIPTKLYKLLTELERLTAQYRSRSGLKQLFYAVSSVEKNKINPLSSRQFNKSLKKFIKENNIYDKNGELYRLRSHDFRFTLASKLVNDWNIPLVVLCRHYGHMSIEMTQHYVHLSKEKLLKKAIAGFTMASTILTNGKTGENFAEIINKAKAESSLDITLEKLRNSFGVNPLPFGICLFDFRRGHCPHLGVQSCWEIECKNFCTNDKFLPSFEHEAVILEQEIIRTEKLGQTAQTKNNKIRHHKLSKIIKQLKN